MDKKSYTFTVRASWVRYGLVGLVTALIVAPLSAGAANRFTDVPDTNVFHDDITWLADAGVTLGCNPPTNDRFCPTNTVTRQTMAAFLKRLSVNQVVDAATAINAEHADHATAADTATTADSATTAATASDADTLDGFDSGVFAKAADVYTKAEIDASTAPVIMAGGSINSDGTANTLRTSFGSFTVSRVAAGNYSIVIPGLFPGCSYSNVPMTLTTVVAFSGDWVATANGGFGISCNSGDTNFQIIVKNNGTQADAAFNFVMYRSVGALNPAAFDAPDGATECLVEPDGTTSCS